MEQGWSICMLLHQHQLKIDMNHVCGHVIKCIYKDSTFSVSTNWPSLKGSPEDCSIYRNSQAQTISIVSMEYQTSIHAAEHTLFRFPLRSATSNLLYHGKVYKLIDALRSDANLFCAVYKLWKPYSHLSSKDS